MLTVRHELEMLFFVIIATAASLLFLMYRDQKKAYSFTPTVPQFILPSATPTPPAPIEETSVSSPDGEKILIMKKQKLAMGTQYTFVTDKVIFQKKEDSSSGFEIPENTWSPNNKYLFIKETTPEAINYLVFNGGGEPFGSTSYFNVTKMFYEKIQDYIITDITGWADPNLLIINAKKYNEERGYSFWFEISSQSFIPLGSYFY